MQIKTYIINAFTDKPFTGNPAGVCLLDISIDAETMLNIAAQLNLSETAFLLKNKEDNTYHIRYFSPTTEVDFCGHATLASSKLVLEELSKEKVELVTKKGLKLSANKQGEVITMIFPLYEVKDYTVDEKLLSALGIKEYSSSKFGRESGCLLIEIADKETLLNLSPNFTELIKSSNELRGLVVTTKSEEDSYDFYSRAFYPWIGINEDPVTGSSFSFLATFWSNKLDKTTLSAFQLSKRGGFLDMKILNNHQLEVQSQAQIIMKGVLHI